MKTKKYTILMIIIIVLSLLNYIFLIDNKVKVSVNESWSGECYMKHREDNSLTTEECLKIKEEKAQKAKQNLETYSKISNVVAIAFILISIITIILIPGTLNKVLAIISIILNALLLLIT